MCVYSPKLIQCAQVYLASCRRQELDHTDTSLNWERQEAHDTLMWQMDLESIQYESRESAAQLAEMIVLGG